MKIGKILGGAGVIFLLCAGCLSILRIGQAWEAEFSASEAYEAIMDIRISPAEPEVKVSGDLAPEPDRQMREETVNGVAYVATLEIPELDLMLPVISKWSDPNGKIAPCRYSGSVYNDDLILCGHNYPSHFGKLKDLTAGDRIAVSDMEGNRFCYEVDGTEILSADEVEKLAAGEWDLTLFTCTPGGRQRLVLRCKRLTAE